MYIVLLIGALVFIIGLILIASAIKDEDFEMAFACLILMLVIDGFCIMPFIALDKSSGSTIGTITAVDKNFFGTTKIYIKTSEANEDEYCAEDYEVINQAKELVGKKVKLYYDERVGLYDLNQCREAPIERIEEVAEK